MKRLTESTSRFALQQIPVIATPPAVEVLSRASLQFEGGFTGFMEHFFAALILFLERAYCLLEGRRARQPLSLQLVPG